jgi:hypothetical protein
VVDADRRVVSSQHIALRATLRGIASNPCRDLLQSHVDELIALPESSRSAIDASGIS